MTTPTSIGDLDLTPPPGKRYFNSEREWREEFIYFLLVDRFHGATPRSPVLGPNRSRGIATPNDFYGGKIKGITDHLDYIAGLGCTAIWLSPVFENNPHAYHGYDINNYLSVEPRFGTKDDLVELVARAHGFQQNGKPFPLRVILDVVINHSGDNWFYPGDLPYFYANDQRFPFGDWRRADRPIPKELRDPELYHRRGQMGDFDHYPENQHADIVGLKDYENDDDSFGSRVVNTLIQAHAYWIREADVDGFRVDAVKHMGELACSRDYTLAFSRMLYGREILIAYNVAGAPRNDAVVIDADYHADGTSLTYLYGGSGNVRVQTAPNGTRYVELPLAPRSFVILG